MNAVEKVKASLSEGTSLLSERQKLILLAGKSEFGWKTVEEYTQHELADSEADGKKIRRAEERADKALKSAASKKSVKHSILGRRTSTLQYGPQNSRGFSALGSWRNQNERLPLETFSTRVFALTATGNDSLRLGVWRLTFMASTTLATPLQPQANSHRKQALKS